MAAAALAIAARGCTSISMPWSGDDAGTAAGASSEARASAVRSIVIVGPFTNPQRSSTGWGNIGSGLSESLRQKLRGRQDLELRGDAAMVNAAQLAIEGPADRIKSALADIHDRHLDVKYIVAGNVADFSHVKSDAAGAASSSRNAVQANATLELAIIDLLAQRVIARERIGGSAWAGSTPAGQTYAGVTFGSYRFWDTPLGLASHDVLDRAVACVAQALPPPQDVLIRIVNRIEGRRVRLASDADRLAFPGDVLRVFVYDSSGTKLRSVLDPQTRAPLTAKIEARGLYPSAWLQGEWPAGVPIPGAVLRKSPL